MTPYQKLVAARKCTQCRRPLLEREKKKCELCIEANRAKRITAEARARDRGYARKSYAKDPEAKRQAVRAEKDRKKREHECRDCPSPAEPDADHCAVHTEKRRKYAQRVWRKTKARRNRERRAAGRQRTLTRKRSPAINSDMVTDEQIQALMDECADNPIIVHIARAALGGDPQSRASCADVIAMRARVASGIPMIITPPINKERREPEPDADDYAWDEALARADADEDRMFTPADSERPRHDEP